MCHLGADEHANKEVKRWGTPRKFNFTPKDHADIGEKLGMMDFEAAAKMSGARFVVLKKHLARLERALTQFMLDVQTEENGYQETAAPLLVRDHAMYGTGQLPKFEEDLFQTGLPERLEQMVRMHSNVLANAAAKRDVEVGGFQAIFETLTLRKAFGPWHRGRFQELMASKHYLHRRSLPHQHRARADH